MAAAAAVAAADTDLPALDSSFLDLALTALMSGVALTALEVSQALPEKIPALAAALR